ncbi:hypothetical protein [Amycolatopsis sp. NPDC006125]|uniref:hypothetical protein n=1 Tax=Amycolatopsis sp. NPDC006125 TaxID=3156730 RepID=UPI0033AB7239
MAGLIDKRVELYLDDWVDVTRDVRGDAGIEIVRGRQNETTKQTTASQCRFRLKNGEDCSIGARGYEPRYAASPYFGKLGRATPVRVGIRTAYDTFTRTVSGGWGTADRGGGWTFGGIGWVASDFSVASGVGRHSVSAATNYRVTYLTTFKQRDADVKVNFTLPIGAPTGGAVEPANLVLRLVDISNYYTVRVSVAPTTGAITLDLYKVVANTYTSLVGATPTGLFYDTAGTSFTVRAIAEGQEIRAKIWRAGQPEPYGWGIRARDTTFPAAGSVGVRSALAAGNTNTPLVFSYDNFEVMHPRFAGEIADIVPNRDTTGKARWVDVEAAGILRRLQAGDSPLQSPLRRAYVTTTDNPPVAYWPLEDGRDSAQFASPIRGVAPMTITQGTVNAGTYSGFAGSAPIAQLADGTLWGQVPNHADGYGQVRMLIHVPDNGLTDLEAIATIHTTGSIYRWRIVYGASFGGTLRMTAFDRTVTLVHTGDWLTQDFNGKNWLLSIELRQVGANIEYGIWRVEAGVNQGNGGTGVISNQTLGHVSDVFIGPDKDISGMAVGHVAVQPIEDSVFTFGPMIDGMRGEYAPDRISRLGTENAFDVAVQRGTEATEPWTRLGPQPIASLTDVLDESARADLGLLFDNRATTDLTYRTYPSLLSQQPVLVLDASNGELAQPPQPVDDDQNLTNDVTAQRNNGGFYRATETEGRLSTTPPEDGGVGTYSSSTSYNVRYDSYLPDLAGWALHLGTVDAARYPRIPVALHNERVNRDNPDLRRQALDLQIGDLIAIDHLDPDRVLVMTLGSTELIGNMTHDLVFTCQPGEPWNVGTADGADSRADSDTSELVSALTATATAFFVATAPGSPRWIDSATYGSEFPFDIRVGGEVMRVTAITGTTSPQTFTVQRSINGVVKAHTALTPVTLANPVYAGAGTEA